MKVTNINIEMTFTEPVLGLCSGDQEIHRKFIVARAKDAAKEGEEVEAIKTDEELVEAVSLEEQIVNAMTVFPRDDIGLFMWDYQLRGCIKEQIYSLIELGEPSVKGLSKWSYKKAVDCFVFVNPRRIYLYDPAGHPWKVAPSALQRPLRATTMQGDRICLASSEMLPVGTSIQFNVELLSGTNPKTKLAVITEDTIRDAFDLGARKGFGQWRSGGWGRFEWKKTDEVRIPELERRNGTNS